MDSPRIDLPSPTRLRIAQVVTHMDIGGVPDHIVTLARGLSRRHDVSVICDRADPTHAAVLAGLGVNIIQVPMRRAPNPLADARAFWQLWRLFRRERFDVVHTHRSKAALVGLLAARTARVPVVVNTAQMFGFLVLRNPLLRGLFWLYDRLLFAVADAVITVYERGRSAIVASGIVAAGKIHTVYNGIDCGRFLAPPQGRNLRRELGIPASAAVAITVARLVPQKGIDLLIAAAAKVVAAHPEAYFLIVGDGPLRATIEAEIERLNVRGNVLLLGERTDIPALLHSADLFALPSVAEGLPIAILEAMAAGKPVVATDVDGNPEAVLEGDTGLIVRSRDPEEMADALARLIVDRTLRERLGRAGRARVEQRFSARQMVDEVEAIYTEIAARRHDFGVPVAQH